MVTINSFKKDPAALPPATQTFSCFVSLISNQTFSIVQFVGNTFFGCEFFKTLKLHFLKKSLVRINSKLNSKLCDYPYYYKLHSLSAF